MSQELTDEDLLNEALDCIYEIRGAYINSKSMDYAIHREELEELERVTDLLEKRLNRV